MNIFRCYIRNKRDKYTVYMAIVSAPGEKDAREAALEEFARQHPGLVETDEWNIEVDRIGAYTTSTHVHTLDFVGE